MKNFLIFGLITLFVLIIFFIHRNKTKSEKRYSFIDGKCVIDDKNGNYDSLESCNKSNPPPPPAPKEQSFNSRYIIPYVNTLYPITDITF
jgi:hypothetical protein